MTLLARVLFGAAVIVLAFGVWLLQRKEFRQGVSRGGSDF